MPAPAAQISTKQSLLIQNRSIEETSETNAMKKPTIAASASSTPNGIGFTFAKETVEKPPNQEIVHSAKIQTQSQTKPVKIAKRLAKRISNPKTPKIVSQRKPIGKSKSQKKVFFSYVYI